ncbi:hypothetical protein M427DRAFT_70488 [Gonapodya prolifera JEL478]|uniref:Uncharacterized protein n=1 Tax=Gonapodya prolifera (strain JEL478) TaxID=1344416 RepID=A0A139AD46_GONPJ|nr:hypothetical protein M427DRAFT_70488 [Gonapodya prolifera JEL478]|eukprot:KXS14721.1 hypothetical protein M427DRAFT_70488 [Gonapodya prolifera JEL478]
MSTDTLVVRRKSCDPASDSPDEDETELEGTLRRETIESLKRYEAMQVEKEARRRQLEELEAQAAEAEVEWQQKRQALEGYAIREHAGVRTLVRERTESHRRVKERSLELALAARNVAEKAKGVKGSRETVRLAPLDYIATQLITTMICLQDAGCTDEAAEAEVYRWEVEDCVELIAAARDFEASLTTMHSSCGLFELARVADKHSLRITPSSSPTSLVRDDAVSKKRYRTASTSHGSLEQLQRPTDPMTRSLITRNARITIGRDRVATRNQETTKRRARTTKTIASEALKGMTRWRSLKNGIQSVREPSQGLLPLPKQMSLYCWKSVVTVKNDMQLFLIEMLRNRTVPRIVKLVTVIRIAPFEFRSMPFQASLALLHRIVQTAKRSRRHQGVSLFPGQHDSVLELHAYKAVDSGWRDAWRRAGSAQGILCQWGTQCGLGLN